MEIQLGFRLTSAKELKALAAAIELVETKEFIDYITIQSNLKMLAEQEATLREAIQKLAQKHQLHAEIDKLRETIEKLKAEEAMLMNRIKALKTIAGDETPQDL